MGKFGMHWLTLRKALFCALRPAFWRQLAYGVAPTIEHREALRRYNFQTVIDVGGNRGQFATFARYMFPKAVIHAFEPLQAPASIHRRVLSHDQDAHFYKNAIGKIASHADIYVTTRDDSSSLLAPATTQANIFGQEVTHTERVSVRRLSDCIDFSKLNRPTLLKIDVQGGELEVLRGSSDVVMNIDVIYVECSYFALYEKQPLYNDIASWLTDRGFRIAGVFNQYIDAKIGPVQADFLFVRILSDLHAKDVAS